MNPDDRPVHVRTSASAQDFWCRQRDEGKEPGNVSPDGKVVLRGQRSFSVLKDLPRTAPYQRQVQPQPQLPPLRASRSVERMMYKKTLHEAENVQPQLSAEIDRLQRENQFLKKQKKMPGPSA